MKRRLLIAIWSLIPLLALAGSDPKVDTFRELRMKTRGNSATTTIDKAWADARPFVSGTAGVGNIGVQGATSTTLSWTAPQTVTVGNATTATTALDSQLLDSHDSTYFEPAITTGTSGQVWLGTKAWSASPVLTHLKAAINATSLTLAHGSGSGKYLTTAADGTTSLVTFTNATVGLGNVENTKLSTWLGTTNVAIVGTVTTGTWGATTVAVNKGGTGLASYTIGDLLYASGTTTLSKLADVATGYFLVSGGIGTAPAWMARNQAAIAGLTTADSPTFTTVNSTGSVVTSGTLRAAGNVNSTGGAIQTASTTRIDNNGNLSAVNVNSTGNVVTSGTLRASGAATLTTTTLTGAFNIGCLTAAPTTVTTGTAYITHAGALKIYSGSAWKTYLPSD